MPWTPSQYSTANQAYNALLADRPFLLPVNALDVSYQRTLSIWSAQALLTNLNWTDTDHSATGFPAWLAANGRANDYTYSGTTNTRYLGILFDCGQPTNLQNYFGGPSFDTVIFWIPNIDAIRAASIDVQFHLGDNSTFSTVTFAAGLANPALHQGLLQNYGIATGLPSYNARLYSFFLQDVNASPNSVFLGGRYARLVFDAGSGNTFTSLGVTPQVALAWAGLRYQLGRWPEYGWSEMLGFETEQGYFRALSGQDYSFVHNKGLIVAQPTWSEAVMGTDTWAGNASIQGAVNQDVNLRQAFIDMQHGSKSFVYVNNPTSQPWIAPLLKIADVPKLDRKRDGPYVANFKTRTWNEMPPGVWPEQGQ